EVEGLDPTERLEGFLLAELGLKQAIERRLLVSGDGIERPGDNDGKLQALGLVNRHERNAAGRSILGLVLILFDAAVPEEAEEEVEEPDQVAFQAVGLKDDDVIEVLVLI